MRKIAILSDIHGNVTALEAVLEDAIQEAATDYWVLGDLIMIGPGSSDLIKRLRELPNAIFVKGNWDDVFLDAHLSDFSKPINVYGSRLAKYHYENLSKEDIRFMKELPAMVIKEVAGWKFLLCHHLPHKNHGGDLWPSEKQENFDLLFARHQVDSAIYGHMHRQLMRQSSEGQLIINPGSVHVPTVFTDWEKQRLSLKPQYVIIDVGSHGIEKINFKKVDYHLEDEMTLAKERNLPYLNFYREGLEAGRSYTHHKEVLRKVNDEYGYKEEVIKFFSGNTRVIG